MQMVVLRYTSRVCMVLWPLYGKRHVNQQSCSWRIHSPSRFSLKETEFLAGRKNKYIRVLVPLSIIFSFSFFLFGNIITDALLLCCYRALLACLHQLARASQDPIEELARLLHQHDHTQRYALHFAAVMGRHAIVNELLTAGHSPHVVDNQQRLPLWYAESKGMADVCAILRTAMERQPLQSTSTAS
eukprot:m.80749 g.80749  ORF g.80749 m.80749 type:complete len:187 (-) comp12609_c1_seq3:252-812(-)